MFTLRAPFYPICVVFFVNTMSDIRWASRLARNARHHPVSRPRDASHYSAEASRLTRMPYSAEATKFIGCAGPPVAERRKAPLSCTERPMFQINYPRTSLHASLSLSTASSSGTTALVCSYVRCYVINVIALYVCLS